ncbi:metallophosphoesterase [Bartonella sp. HY038]|uniref:metallophosphoesterase family protein n=1 Tax=Bartonella sp. HY038 TaxID=2759660 RepID=UPI0015F885C1|nr:metallophosphoesterase [Bartonella sp. HY038]
MQKIAILSDIHLHDIYFGYGLFEADSGDLGLRSLKDSMASTRVFNESIAALNNALNDIQKRGIKHVVLLGDLTDDGQAPNYQALKNILDKMSLHYQMQFYALFGNHDCFGDQGKLLEKWLVKASDQQGIHVTGNKQAEGHVFYSPDMVCSTKAQALEYTKHWGMGESPNFIYHETPKKWLQASGKSTDDYSFLASDSSYLLEIEDDIWLILLDGNIVRQDRTGKYILHANAAWQKTLEYRPYIEGWIADIVRRGKQKGKTVLAFSHYPMVGFPRHEQTNMLAGGVSWAKRMPALAFSEKLAKTGLCYHFSGHMHALGHSQFNNLHNYAMPSTVSFPAGYGIIEIDNGNITIDAILLENVENFEIAFPLYKNERSSHFKDTDFIGDYQGFLLSSIRHLIDHKYLKRDWPHDFLDIKEQLLIAFISPRALLYRSVPQKLTIYQCLIDYYLLLFGSYFALPHIDEENINFYQSLPVCFNAEEFLKNEQSFISLIDFLGIMSKQAKSFAA